jgi:hypothetical protein
VPLQLSTAVDVAWWADDRQATLDGPPSEDAGIVVVPKLREIPQRLDREWKPDVGGPNAAGVNWRNVEPQRRNEFVDLHLAILPAGFQRYRPAWGKCAVAGSPGYRDGPEADF